MQKPYNATRIEFTLHAEHIAQPLLLAKVSDMSQANLLIPYYRSIYNTDQFAVYMRKRNERGEGKKITGSYCAPIILKKL